MLHRSFKGVSRKFQGCCVRKFERCFKKVLKGVSRKFPGYFKELSRMFQDSFKGFKEVQRFFQGSFKGVLRAF